MRFWMHVIIVATVGLWVDGALAQQDPALLAERFAAARQGHLVQSDSAVEVWQLPYSVRKSLALPKVEMLVSGENGYFVAGQRVFRPGDQIDGKGVIEIRSRYVILEVDGYQVKIH